MVMPEDVIEQAKADTVIVPPHEQHYVLFAVCTGLATCAVVGGMYAYASGLLGGQNGVAMFTEEVSQMQRGSGKHTAQIGGDATEAETNALPPALYLRESLIAQSAIVFDAETGHVLYDYRASEAMPLASITKVMTALAITSLLQGSDTLTITQNAIETEGYDTLHVGEKWTVDDLVDFMLITSSNKAAQALHDAGRAELESRAETAQLGNLDPRKDVFIEYMNVLAKRIGMQATTFTNATGLDTNNDTVATNFGSARDVAQLFAYILQHKPRLIEATKDDSSLLRSQTGMQHNAITTNKAISEIPGLIGGKTGFTDIAGGNLAVAFDVEPGHPVVLVVLGSGKDERFADILTLVASVRNYFGMRGVQQASLPAEVESAL